MSSLEQLLDSVRPGFGWRLCDTRTGEWHAAIHDRGGHGDCVADAFGDELPQAVRRALIKHHGVAPPEDPPSGNVVHGPLDGLYLPEPDPALPWQMLISYAGDDADSAVPVCYWWQDDRQRWVYQAEATRKSVPGVRGQS